MPPRQCKSELENAQADKRRQNTNLVMPWVVPYERPYLISLMTRNALQKLTLCYGITISQESEAEKWQVQLRMLKLGEVKRSRPFSYRHQCL